MSGYQNIYLSIGLFSLAFLLIMWALIPTMRSVWVGISSLSISEAQKTLGLFIVIFLIISAILNSLAAYKVLSWKPQKFESQAQNIQYLSPKELELKLRKVSDTLGYKTGSRTNAEATFQFVITDLNGVNLNIFQLKDPLDIITIQLMIELSQDIQQKIAKLKERDRKRLIRELTMTIDRQGILRSSLLPLKTITLTDPFLKEDLQNLSVFTQKVRNMFLIYYSVMNVISSFIEQ